MRTESSQERSERPLTCHRPVRLGSTTPHQGLAPYDSADGAPVRGPCRFLLRARSRILAIGPDQDGGDFRPRANNLINPASGLAERVWGRDTTVPLKRTHSRYVAMPQLRRRSPCRRSLRPNPFIPMCVVTLRSV